MTKHQKTLTRRPRTTRAGTKAVSPELQAQIGRRLKAMYQDVLAEPVPDKFTRLLEQLDQPRGDADGGEKP